MTTKLDKAIKREIDFNGVLYTVTLSPDGLKIVEKGKRLGQELAWRELIGGGASSAQESGNPITGSRGQESQG